MYTRKSKVLKKNPVHFDININKCRIKNSSMYINWCRIKKCISLHTAVFYLRHNGLYIRHEKSKIKMKVVKLD